MKRQKKSSSLEFSTIDLELYAPDESNDSHQDGIGFTSKNEKIEADDDQTFTFDTHPFYRKIKGYDYDMPDKFAPVPEKF